MAKQIDVGTKTGENWSDSNDYRFSFGGVIRETEKAVLIQCDAQSHRGNQPEVWLAKSIVSTVEVEVNAHRTDTRLCVPAWWIHKNELYPFI